MRFGPARIHIVADTAPHDTEDTWSLYWIFQYKEKETPDLRITVRMDPPPPARELRLLGEVSTHWHLYEDGDLYRLEVMDRVSLKPKQIVMFDKTWSEAAVHVIPLTYRAPKRLRSGWVLCDLMEPLVQWWLSSWLALRDKGMVFHASAVAFENQGLIFIGESGAGKTTLARLCSQEKDATVLNDERIVLWRDGPGWRVGGTPWHGELAKASAETAGLARVCLLKKAPFERFTPRSGVSFMMEIVQQAFLPVWSAEAMNRSLELIERLLHEVPSGELQFRKDPQVVEFLRNLVKSEVLA